MLAIFKSSTLYISLVIVFKDIQIGIVLDFTAKNMQDREIMK